ncbi:MAG: response regulator [Anaerolineales bacterium]
MSNQNQPITILIADDDLDDCVLLREAFQESVVDYRLLFVHDGTELLQFLSRQGKFTSPASAPTPDLVLLDLNMPGMDGREALAEIKANPNIRRIPVVVLTLSRDPQDIMHIYDLGGSGFIIKPETFEGMLEVINVLSQYWFETVELASGQSVKKASRSKTYQSFSG